ncbi:MAG: exosortase A [Sphingosinicella sp.]|uniref:exosortase A n=1 Tax=Sphingosinicella sp. TaxID=1917971 RepID=UPI0040376D12
MTVALPIARPIAPSAWRTHLLALGALDAAILGQIVRDAADKAVYWWNNATFNHCLLIPPIIAWLVWQRLPELRQLSPSAWPAGLALLGAGALAWLLGEAGGVALVRHFALIFMLQGAVIACLGWNVTRGLAFPIFYALFLVPAGAELVPWLQTVTADIAMALLGISGVPAHLEGIFITTPIGYFEVAEACAGARFLIAMVAFGALVANVCFRSWPRRIAFMAVAIVVPILANGVRAWATIYVAEQTGSVEFAASFDHVIYGGVFFAIVIALILAAAWPFFDRGTDEPWLDRLSFRPGPKRSPLAFTALAALTLVILPLAWTSAIATTGVNEVPSEFALPDVPGWQRVPALDRIVWRPYYAGADLFRIARYRDSAGREVDLAIAVYARQSEGRELVGFGQGAVAPDGAWAWTGDAPAPPNGRAERIGSHGLVREVVSFYRIGDILTGSAMGVKLETMKARLIGGPQRAVAVLVSAPQPATGTSARPQIDAFLAALGPVERLADRAAGLE